MLRKLIRIFSLPLLAAASLLFGVLRGAQLEHIINGPGNKKWKQGGSWTNEAVPNGSNSNATINTGSGAEFEAGDHFSVNRLTILGNGITATGTSSLTITGTGSTWQNGTLQGSGVIGQLIIASGGDLTLSAGPKTLNAFALNNQGSLFWTSGVFNTGNGATISNASGATFNTTFDGTLANNQGGTGTIFTNAGTFSKTAGTGTTSISAAFINTGTLSITSGIVQLNGGGTSSTLVSIGNASSRLQIATSNFQFNDGSILNGPGAVEVLSGTTTFSGFITGTAGLSLVGGTAVVLGNTSLSGVSALTGGTLTGGGTFTVGSTAAPSTWSGTALTGTGTLKIGAGASLELTGSGIKSYSRNDGNSSGGRIIENLGTMLITGTGSLLGGDGGQILNQSGGLFHLQSNATIGHTGFGDQPSFTNAGTFRKSANASTAIITNLAFTNSGRVEVFTGGGTLAFTTGVTSNSGTFDAAAGAAITFTGGQTFNSGTQFTGAGTVSLDAGTSTLSGAISTQNLRFTGGQLQGTSTISGLLNWTGGDWLGNATLTIGSTATLTITGAAIKQFARGDGNSSGGRTITNLGDIIWNGAGTLLGGDGGQILNQASGEFFIQSDTTLGHTGFGSMPSFTNSGLLRKNTTTGTSTIAVPFIASGGTVDVQTGVLAFTQSVTSHGGTFTTASGTSLTFSGAKVFNTGTTFNSGGAIRLLTGDTTFSGAITSTGLEFAGGELYGNATVSGTMSWTGGTWRGADTIAFGPGSTLTLSGSGTKTLTRADGNSTGGRVLQTSGLLHWQNAGPIVGNDGAGISVASGGVLEIRNDSSYSHGGFGSIPFLTNTGTVRKLASSGTTTINGVSFTNQGALEVQTGTLSLMGSGGLANNGTVTVSSGATLLSSASGMTSDGGTFNVFTGGQLRFTNGTNTISNSTFTGHGLTEVAGGTLVISATDLSGNFKLTSGTIGGGGIFSVGSSGQFTWNGGNLNGTGTLLVGATGQMTIDGAAAKSFSRGDGNSSGGRTISNFGNVTWADAGSILGGDGAQFVNQAGAFFTITGNALFGHTGFGDSPTFFNTGTVRKTAGAGVSEFGRSFTNNGVLESNTGTVRLSGGGSGNGQFKAQGGEIVFANSYTLNNGARLLGSTYSRLTASTMSISTGALVGIGTTSTAGRFAFDGGTIDGAGILLVDQLGKMDWNGGSLQGTGTLRVAAGGELRVLNSVNHDFLRGDGNSSGGRVIENFGSIIWSAGTLRGGDGAQILNQVGGLFEVSGGTGLAHTGFGNTPTFTNLGTFRKSGVGAASVSNTAFFTNNLVDVTGGSLTFNSGVTSNASTFNTGAAAALTFAGGQTFNTGTVFGGAGVPQITAGDTLFNGSITVGHLVLAGGNINGTATISGLLEWAGGDLRGPGTFTIPSTSELLITGSGTRSFYRGDGNSSGGRVIDNFGVIVLDNAGDLRGGDGAQIINRSSGVFVLSNDRILGHTGFGDAPSFLNEGMFVKEGGGGTSTIAVPFTNASTGTIAVESGALAFTSTFINNNGHVTLSADGQLSVAGQLQLGTGTLSGHGAINAPGGVSSNGQVFAQELAITGDLSLLGSAFLHLEINGATPALALNGNATVGGHLGFTFVEGFGQAIGPTSTFTLLTSSSSIAGSFLNVANGQRLNTLNGLSSFQVNYGLGSAFANNSVVLSHFQAIPEPSTYVLLGIGGIALVFSRRRRR